MSHDLYVLGGAQTDFARNWAKEGLGLLDMLTEVLPATFADAQVPSSEVQVVHVGNLAGELFAGQAQLGGLVAAADPGLVGLPSTRHEAACASGSTALVAAGADIASGRYDVALVVGLELMRNVSAKQAADHLGTAAWAGREAVDAEYAWPALFAEVADEYEVRYGLDHAVLGRFAEIAFANGADNPLAQARDWAFPAGSFAEDDDVNPLVEGRLRKTDCGRITDGAAAVVLAGADYAAEWAAARGLDLEQVPRLSGFGHRTDTLLLADKLDASRGTDHLFPHLHGTIHDAYRRAGLSGIDDVDVVEMHDCFTITGLVTLEHLGLVAGGKGGEVVHDGTIERSGRLPVNPGGGLLAAGHPVGATGVRMVLDATRQVTGRAGATQVDGARRVLTVNVGGSFTTAVAFVVETGA
ncbi:acetyl-CoA acetyltransferase [Aeromicrobium fastidiosum]|uniref:propanoyl-CoA C-acyltransferase n=1 Tax=Aeromicrobium fastidiosum TaxID=52699 RepID=A0A641APR3_9ACTN|nr:acetyl-CoA acetyltransferase [Aeromicrobium fastidiosum]KAA1380094.1 thiolase domain-containing protein [Aeromicrobium fastidiosum]MBP2389625.1 acetyl-CoA C-acetyltransferase [Aeromicrobium fastidiosum]